MIDTSYLELKADDCALLHGGSKAGRTWRHLSIRIENCYKSRELHALPINSVILQAGTLEKQDIGNDEGYIKCWR